MLTNINAIKTTKITCQKQNVDHVQNSSRISKFQTIKQQNNYQIQINNNQRGNRFNIQNFQQNYHHNNQDSLIKTKSLECKGGIKRVKGISRIQSKSSNKIIKGVQTNTNNQNQEHPKSFLPQNTISSSGLKSRLKQKGLEITKNKHDEQHQYKIKIHQQSKKQKYKSPYKVLQQKDYQKIRDKNKSSTKNINHQIIKKYQLPGFQNQNYQSKEFINKQKQIKEIKFDKSHYSNQLQFCYEKIHYLEQQLVIIQKQKIQLENHVKSLKEYNFLLQGQLKIKNNPQYVISSPVPKSKSPKKGIQVTQSPKKKNQNQKRLINQIQQLISKNKHLAYQNQQRGKQISQLQQTIRTLRGKLRDSVRQQQQKLQTIVNLQKDLLDYKSLKSKLIDYQSQIQSFKHIQIIYKNQIQQLKQYQSKNIQNSKISNQNQNHLQIQINRFNRKIQYLQNQLQLQRKKSKRYQIQIDQISKKYDRRIIQRQQEILKLQKIIKQLNDDIRFYITASSNCQITSNNNNHHNNLNKTYRNSIPLALNQNNYQNQGESIIKQLQQSHVVYKQMHQEIQMISLKKQQLRSQNMILRQQLQTILIQLQNTKRDIQKLVNQNSQLVKDLKQRNQETGILIREVQSLKVINQKIHNQYHQYKQYHQQTKKSFNRSPIRSQSPIKKYTDEVITLKDQILNLNKDISYFQKQNQKYKQLIIQIESQKTLQVQTLQTNIKQLQNKIQQQKKILKQQNYKRLQQMQAIFERNRNISSLQILNKNQQLQRKYKSLQYQLKCFKEGQEIYQNKKISMQNQYEKIIYNYKQEILKIQQQKLDLIQYNKKLKEKQQRHFEQLNFQRKQIQNHYQNIIQARRLSNSNRKRSLSRSPTSKYIPNDQDPSTLKRQIEYLKTQLNQSKNKIKDLINKMNNHIYQKQRNQQEIKQSFRKIKHLQQQLIHIKIDKQKIYKEKVDLLEQINKNQMKEIQYQNLIKNLQDKAQLYLNQLKQFSQIEHKYQNQMNTKFQLINKIKISQEILERLKNQNILIEERYKSFVNLNEKYKSQIISLENQLIKYKEIIQILKKQKNSIQIKSKAYHSQSVKPLEAMASDRASRQKLFLKLSTIKSQQFSINYQQGQSQYQFLTILYQKCRSFNQHLQKQINQKNDYKNKLLMYDQVCKKYQQLQIGYNQIKVDYNAIYQKYIKYKQIARAQKQRIKDGRRMTIHNIKYHQDIIQHCQRLIHHLV